MSYPINRKNNSGQNVLEYMIIMALVMAGIIIGGPYVIRSWNAHLKGWEDSVKISQEDPLLEAPVSNAINPPNCVYSLLDLGCSGTSWVQVEHYIGGSNCPADYRIPTPSINCCVDAFISFHIENCGCPAGATANCGCSAGKTSCPLPPDPGSGCGGIINDPKSMANDPIHCSSNEACIRQICGEDSTNPPLEQKHKYSCVADARCNQCLGQCPGDNCDRGGNTHGKPCDSDWSDLQSSVNITTVKTGECSDPFEPLGPKCEFECQFPYFPGPIGATCVSCGPDQVYQGDSCKDQAGTCEGGLWNPTTSTYCAADECLQGEL